MIQVEASYIEVWVGDVSHSRPVTSIHGEPTPQINDNEMAVLTGGRWFITKLITHAKQRPSRDPCDIFKRTYQR